MMMRNRSAPLPHYHYFLHLFLPHSSTISISDSHIHHSRAETPTSSPSYHTEFYTKCPATPISSSTQETISGGTSLSPKLNSTSYQLPTSPSSKSSGTYSPHTISGGISYSSILQSTYALETNEENKNTQNKI